VVDPLGGSYYVERLTAELAARARAVIQEVEAHGGMTQAIQSGLARGRIEAAAARRRRAWIVASTSSSASTHTAR
jgi:methylmalonyl-CoA mutase